MHPIVDRYSHRRCWSLHYLRASKLQSDKWQRGGQLYMWSPALPHQGDRDVYSCSMGDEICARPLR
jgi:hypothetical protein